MHLLFDVQNLITLPRKAARPMVFSSGQCVPVLRGENYDVVPSDHPRCLNAESTMCVCAGIMRLQRSGGFNILRGAACKRALGCGC
ncbi:MAG: hypothetical protein DWI63_03070, partial [Chloroflexi bacterium]